jgi:hypothetical protein
MALPNVSTRAGASHCRAVCCLFFHCTGICAVAHPALQSTHVHAHPALGSSQNGHTHAHSCASIHPRSRRCEQCGLLFCSECCHRTKEIVGKSTPAHVCEGCYAVLDRRALPLGAHRPSSRDQPGVGSKVLSVIGLGSKPSKASRTSAGHDGIKPKHRGEPHADLASLILEDEGDRFTYACLIASFVSDQRVPSGECRHHAHFVLYVETTPHPFCTVC